MNMSKESIDLTGRTCIVTGANSGIGKAVARGLASYGATVVMACRSESRGRAALDELRSETGSDRLHLRLVDLSEQASIRHFATDFLSEFDALHVLVNNAGIYPAERQLSPDGIEMTWATNVMAYYLLTDLLEQRLRDCAPSRIVNVASTKAGQLRLDDLQFEKRHFGGIAAYEQSKQANRMLSWVRADKLKSDGVTVNVAHPGAVATGIARHQTGLWGKAVRVAFQAFGRSTQTGGDTALWLASSSDVDGLTGRFWAKRRELTRTFFDPKRQVELSEYCASMIR
jgi:NAD(P)-dependent dehydrogenase (short-subunit alcohol dehydrogenase family)